MKASYPPQQMKPRSSGRVGTRLLGLAAAVSCWLPALSIVNQGANVWSAVDSDPL